MALGKHLTPDEITELKKLISTGLSVSEVNRQTGHSRNTIRLHRVSSDHFDDKVQPQVVITPVQARRETMDSGFWRNRAKQHEAELAKAESMIEQLSGVRSIHVLPPEWLLSKSTDRLGHSVIGLLLTDIHAGEVIASDEVLGLNEFNIAVCRDRLRRYFSAVCEVGTRWGSDTAIQGAVLNLGGDLISGDIHEELRITNELTAHEQVRFAVEEIVSGIKHLKRAFRRVHVPSVPGNHGRTTFKPTAKLYSRLSYDTMIAQMVADQFIGDDNVTFQITAAPDAVYPILGFTHLLTHGDKMGTGGGQGFAGPVLPIVRGTKKVEAQQARAGRRPDLILHGHYHTSANPGAVLSNGSVPGYSEYGHGLRAAIEPPQQWAYLVHQKWGLRERAEIKLSDPLKPELPRVRIPAVMARAA